MESPHAFWQRVGLGRNQGRRRRRRRASRVVIHVVMWEAAVNRNARGYTFLSAPSDESSSVSVVRGEPGKAAVSAVWFDSTRTKLRARFLGQHGASFATTCDRYAADNPRDTKPAVVVAVDANGTVLYSADLIN